eukprot:CFRG0262T1
MDKLRYVATGNSFILFSCHIEVVRVDMDIGIMKYSIIEGYFSRAEIVVAVVLLPKQVGIEKETSVATA